jgi:hypothetical protein
MRKFIFLAFGSGLLSALISEISFTDWHGSLIAGLIFLLINGLFLLAYKFDDMVIKSIFKTLKELGLDSPESFNLALIVMWGTFNVIAIIWRWSYVN